MRNRNRGKDIEKLTLFAYQEKYVAKVYPHIKNVCKEQRYDPAGLIAASAIITNWGKLVPKESNNHFLRVAQLDWPGERIEQEIVQLLGCFSFKKKVYLKKYSCIEDSFVDFMGDVHQLYEYADLFRDEPRKFLTGLRKAKVIIGSKEHAFDRWEARLHTFVLVRVQKAIKGILQKQK